MVHVENADKRQELAVERRVARLQVEVDRGGQRERLEQATTERIQRVGPGHAQVYLYGVVFVIRVHEPVVNQKVGVRAHPVEYEHLFVGRVLAVRVANNRVVRSLVFGGQLCDETTFLLATNFKP